MTLVYFVVNSSTSRSDDDFDLFITNMITYGVGNCLHFLNKIATFWLWNYVFAQYICFHQDVIICRFQPRCYPIYAFILNKVVQIFFPPQQLEAPSKLRKYFEYDLLWSIMHNTFFMHSPPEYNKCCRLNHEISIRE